MRRLATTMLLLYLPSVLSAQGWVEPRPGLPGDADVVRLRTEVHARVQGRVAQVAVEEWFENRGAMVGEGDYLYPLPGEAVFSNFSLFQGDEELRGEAMDAAAARRIYEEIVRRRRDPALIELAGHGLLRARIFPIAPGETRRITLRYTQLLASAGDALQFRYSAGLRHARDRAGAVADGPRPRASGMPEQTALAFRMTIDEGGRFRDPFSPTHRVEVARQGESIAVRPVGEIAGDFAVFLPFAQRAVGISLSTHRPAGEDGYFMLTLSPGAATAAQAVPRDLTVVVDISGSMSGGKMEQAKEALRQLLATLDRRDRFRLVAFGSDVRIASEGWSDATGAELASARRWVDSLQADGGTNIAGALAEAFRLKARTGALPIVVFLTDGLPSVGESDPERLAMIAAEAGGRTRVFAFGIGYDVNTHLLDRLGEAGRGTTEYVEPGESVEAAVGQLATRIRHPVLTDLKIARQPARLTEILPAPLPDLFAGEELVIFGRYTPAAETVEGPLEISGVRNGRMERFSMRASFPSHRTADDYIARLWASRKLGELDRRIRLGGARSELVEEARQLALRHGLVSAYSSYLVLEPGQLTLESTAGQVLERPTAGMAPQAQAADVTGVDAVRAADQASRRRAVRSEAELVELSAATAPSAPNGRTVGARHFRRVEGRWVDLAHRDQSPALEVEPFSGLYFDLLRLLPELRAVWRELEESVVAGERVSIGLMAGGRTTMTEEERADLVRAFRGR